ncbi:cytochrome P450 [Gulosibacter chungangensis]|uniref:Cytochrome P450 n=1 Tax=Gulosibacter chungangensis TaxID=979746 RepID=A0A7J5B7J0_9MICO|nr:cytochrome P450 [Gulosibacter chungangensis]KAB1640967.1 cytochrome P450 [Gulosibacter chungangensis]
MSAIAATELPYFDIADPSFAMQSEAVRAARDASWIARTNYGYAVLRYEEVSELLKSPKLSQGSKKWPDHHGVHSGLFYDWWEKNLLVLEGDEHHRIRRLLNPAFSPSMARKLEPEFKALAEELIANVVDKGEMEFVSDFSEPFATRALCIMMGLDHKHWEFIADRANTVGYALSVNIKEDIDRVDYAVKELYDFVEELIQERQANPGQDVVSRLVQFSEGGDKLSAEELRNALVLMLFGGMDTTRNQLGLMLHTFIHNSDQWEKLAANPELTKAALEETLRVNPTTRWVTREALEDFEYKGVEIAAGTTVHLFTFSSGTDPEAFPNPEIDIEAEDRKPHFTFGGGVHHCLGHYIARADMSQALPVLAANLTNIQVVPGGDEWLPDSGNTGPVKLTVTFDKRA